MAKLSKGSMESLERMKSIFGSDADLTWYKDFFMEGDRFRTRIRRYQRALRLIYGIKPQKRPTRPKAPLKSSRNPVGAKDAVRVGDDRRVV